MTKLGFLLGKKVIIKCFTILGLLCYQPDLVLVNNSWQVNAVMLELQAPRHNGCSIYHPQRCVGRRAAPPHPPRNNWRRDLLEAFAPVRYC